MKKLLFALTFIATFLFAAPAFAYTVQKGDTMTSIADDHGVTLEEIAEANPQIENLDFILVGQDIHINKKEVEKKEVPKTVIKKNKYKLLSLFDDVNETMTVNITTEVSTAVSETKVEEDNTETVEETMDVSSEEVVESNDDDSLTISDFTEDEIDLLARIVRAEAQGEPFEGKAAVAAVVLNRLESPQYPDTVREVIYQKNQFQPVRNGQVNKAADEASFEAVYAALTDMRDIAKDSLFFYNPTIATSRWLDTRQTTLVIGQHTFKK